MDKNAPIMAVVVDASPAVCDHLTALLMQSGNIVVVGKGANGEDAVRLAGRLRPDVVVMDMIMPRLDGLEATRQIMRQFPTRIILLTASVSGQEVDQTFQAMQAGALSLLQKPDPADADACAGLVKTVRLMARVPVVHHWGRKERQAMPLPGGPGKDRADLPAIQGRQIEVIGIASSTGGPGVLAAILGQLPKHFPAPVLVVQHVTNGFAGGLAGWLNGQTPLEVRTAVEGERPQAGQVLIAPDDVHLQISRRGVVELVQEPPYRGLRPSANYLFHSLARVYESHAAGIILTGMGDDGVAGLEALRQAGGLTLAQDESSSVVYGMPREAVERGAAGQSLHPEQMVQVLSQLVSHHSEEKGNA